jgi:hypothetical protein
MLTESQARELLQRAAATIDVAPTAAPVMLGPRRNWIAPTVAAAAVLGAVAAGLLLLDRPGPSSPPIDSPSTAPATPATPVPTADPTAKALAAGLTAFALGESDTFPGRETVRFYSEGAFWNSLTGSRAEDRDSYSLCSGFAPPACGPSYLDAMGRARGGYTVTPDLPGCFDQKRVVGERRGGGSRTAYITNPISVACDSAWAIQIRYDNPDRLVAVNVMSTVPDPERDARDVADRFIAFARGVKDTLPVDTPVRLFQNETYVRTLSAAEVEDRASYRTCDARPCAFSALEVIRKVTEKPALRRSPYVKTCLEAHTPVLTAGETGASASVLISDVDHPCDWGVQLWINDVGQIVAIDLRAKGKS